MPNHLLPTKGYRHSLEMLKRVPGAASDHDELYQYLKRFATADRVYRIDDFDRKAIDSTNLWSVANGGGAGVASFATNVQNNGVVRATTGTANDATASASLIGQLNKYGDLNAGLEVRFKFETSIAALKFEVGFIDAVPGSNAGGVTDEDTPTLVAGDAALVSLDTSETYTKLGFYTKGSTASQNAARTSLSGIPGLTSGTDIIISTYLTVRIQLLTNYAYCWVNGALVASHDTQAAGHVEGGVALAPWVYVAANSATSKSMDVDYVEYWQDRA